MIGIKKIIVLDEHKLGKRNKYLLIGEDRKLYIADIFLVYPSDLEFVISSKYLYVKDSDLFDEELHKTHIPVEEVKNTSKYLKYII